MKAAGVAAAGNHWKSFPKFECLIMFYLIFLYDCAALSMPAPLQRQWNCETPPAVKSKLSFSTEPRHSPAILLPDRPADTILTEIVTTLSAAILGSWLYRKVGCKDQKFSQGVFHSKWKFFLSNFICIAFLLYSFIILEFLIILDGCFSNTDGKELQTGGRCAFSFTYSDKTCTGDTNSEPRLFSRGRGYFSFCYY